MNRIFSVNFWVQTFVSTFMTMIMIFIIKQLFTKVNVPVVSNIVESV